jgi:DNA mismatch repair protein MutL
VVEVRTLFFNVPARRKFLKAESAETSRITDAVEAIALAHPAVAFELRSNGRRLLDLAPTDEPARRTLDVLGAELAPELLEFEERFPEIGGLVVRGFAGRPSVARPSSRAIRIHLNGRPISDRLVVHAVREAYRGLVDPARSPTVALMLEIDPREVDVNVHPAKSEVRFRSGQAVHSAVRKTILGALRAANLVPSFTPDALRALPDEPRGLRAPLFGPGGVAGGSVGGGAGVREDRVLAGSSDFAAFAALASEAVAGARSHAFEARGSASARQVAPDALREDFPFIQLLGGFVVTEDEDGIVIVDQHALHERAMFATFLERLALGPLESQRLLVPTVVERSAREVEMLGEIEPLLARLGISARPFGPRSIAVDAVPTLLHSRHVDAAEFVGELLDKAVEHGSLVSLEAALHEVVDMMACKAAVKAGDSLTHAEIRALLRIRESVERSSACPHGRPTSIRIARNELERRFGRS